MFLVSMIGRVWVFVILIALVMPSCGQINPVRLAQGKFGKAKWREGRALLNKAIRKDSLQVQARYVYAQLFLDIRFPNYNIDSAYFYSLQTIRYWTNLTAREKDRLKKFPIDSLLLYDLRNAIDSLAFAKAKEIDTENSYQHFLQDYPYSPQRALAIELRDEAAFGMALQQNTHTAFDVFLKNYPNSHRAIEAGQRFERLLYSFSTRNNTLQEYKEFVSQYPSSPHAQQALAEIYEHETLNGEPDSFRKFIKQYSNTQIARQAVAWLIHLLPESERANFNDSLKKIYPLRNWLPMHQDHGWGYISATGKVVLVGLPWLQEDLLCQPLQTDFIITQEGVFSRTGTLILSGEFESVSDIGAGFLFVTNYKQGQLIHKSGYEIKVEGIESAQIINQRFIGVKQSGLWALLSLTGKKLTEPIFQSIEQVAGFTLFNRAGKRLLVSREKILDFARGDYQPLVADEIKQMGNRIWLRNGALEQVVDSELNILIPFARHQITNGPLGLMVKQNDIYKLPDWPLAEPSGVNSVTIAEPWAIIRSVNSKPSLHHIPTKKIVEHLVDSIWFDQSLVLIKRGDSTRLRLANQQTINLPSWENITIRQAKDSALYILTRNKNRTRVIDARTFKEIFRTEYFPEPILNTVFLFESRGKKGLLNNSGKIILPATYDAILYNQGTFALLKGNLFGTFHPATNKTIKPTFESNLHMIAKETFIARKNSKWGFLSAEGKSLSAFEYDAIQPWSDSLALIQKNKRQSLVSIGTGKVVLDSLDAVQPISLDVGQTVSIVKRNESFGLVNKSGQMVIKAEFDELIAWNVNGETMFLGLQAINPKTCSVLYFDSNGKVVYSFQTSKEMAYTLLCD